MKVIDTYLLHNPENLILVFYFNLPVIALNFQAGQYGIFNSNCLHQSSLQLNWIDPSLIS